MSTLKRLAVMAAVVGLSVSTSIDVKAGDLLKPAGLELVNVQAKTVEHHGRAGLQVIEAAGIEQGVEKLAVIPGIAFGDGTIELELSGAPREGAFQGARGFVGVAFRVQEDRQRYEAFYLRPTNGRAEDQLRRNHSAQYISHPEFPWHRLRQESPGAYETYVDLVPGEWTKVKIVVSGQEARLFVHGADQPTLIVKDLKLGEPKGAVALWIGPSTVAHFANLRVTK